MVDFDRSKRTLIGALILVNFVFAPAAKAADGYKEIASNGILFEYKVRDAYLDARVTCDTTGWVAAGFDPDKQMANANIIIGYVEPDQTLHIRDDYGTDATHHKAVTALGGKDVITNASGAELNEVTRIAFTIPLESNDAYNAHLTLGKMHKLILGCGKDGFDNFVAIHKKVALVDLPLEVP